MAAHAPPKFHNDTGVLAIEIGVKEFECIGALPPFDHPHIFLDMGDGTEKVCPYCSTLYTFKADLNADESRPSEAIFNSAA